MGISDLECVGSEFRRRNPQGKTVEQLLGNGKWQEKMEGNKEIRKRGRKGEREGKKNEGMEGKKKEGGREGR